ncbi:uncharacterized protein LOC106528281 isoform X1 [Austrofundulus limnaeus]|uniref:Uncharacterized protein LOC106528281 isoform X1 n=1 Tax=Austrofundulus limnaeus TaxID=52670 RepID=A0A2I4CFU9_AUSLI|nr:PREDICTED: sentrin-specific protease 5 isoform X1 [Austrofundulus limnaeus]
MYQTGNRCRKAASLQRWKKFMSSVKGASHLSRRAKRRLYFKLQFWFWRKRSEKHRLWLVRGQRGASGISSRLGLTLPSQKVEDLTNHLENRTVSERPAVPEPEERPDGGSGGAVQQNGRSGWSASDSSSETLCDSGCLQLTDSNFSSLVVGQTTQTALASLPSSERSVQLRETTSPLKLPHNVNPLPRADSNACDEQPEVLPADPLSQQHSHVFSYQDQMSTTTQCVDDRISSETTSPTNICLYELTTNIQDFLDGFYRRYGSFIPLCKEDLLGHLKRKFNSDLSDRRNQIISEVFRYQAAVIEKPIPSFQVVYKKHRLTLEDLLTLADQSWLNDQVMNMYGELIMESSHHKVQHCYLWWHRWFFSKALNNLASTTLAFFQGSVEEFGFPLRVRADQGVENVDVARLMFMIRGTGRSSFLSGKSVHNQRIERLWRDLWTAVTSIYYDVLHYLEEEGYLNISNETHLFCCHYVFLPRLQEDLDTFRSGWDNHPLRTESNMTPNQLWVLGRTHHPIPEPHSALTEGVQIPEIEWEESGLPLQEESNVTVPNLNMQLTDEQMAALTDAVNPKDTSLSFGCDIYIAAVQFCEQFFTL